ncbi:MAG: HAMP domain-containing protein, partial [Boseongicola sp.]
MQEKRFHRVRSAVKVVTFGLGRRLMLVFGTLLSFFVAAALLINLQTQKELIEQRLSARVESLGQLVVDISSSHLYEMRVAELEIILEDIYRQPDVDYIYLLDEKNLRLANGRIDETGSFLIRQDDPLAELARDTGQNQQVRGSRTEDVALPVTLGGRYFGTIRFGIALDEINSDLKTVQSRNLTFGVIFVIIGILLTGLIARQLTRPLGDLINMTHRASKGDLNQSIGLRTNDELEFLATSFTDMMAALRKSMRDVQILAYRDKLTGLPNRAWFNEYFENMTAQVASSGCAAALLFLDIDRFKNV